MTKASKHTMTQASPPNSTNMHQTESEHSRSIFIQKLDPLLNVIGNYNPQLFRELKGQLKQHHLSFAIGLSALVQFLVWMAFQGKIPVSDTPGEIVYHRYCVEVASHTNGYQDMVCQYDRFGKIVIDWTTWNHDLTLTLSVMMITGLILGGVFQLINNFAQERKSGTLNFLRLTPQPSERILMGKLLGVPAMIYLAVAIALPLQLWSAMGANFSPENIVLFYASAIEVAALFFCGALLLATLGTTQGWLGAIMAGSFLYPIMGIFYILFVNPTSFFEGYSQSQNVFYWWAIPLSASRLAFLVTCWMGTAIVVYWLWQAINRQFRNPNATIFSKQQSYWILAEYLLFWMGFMSNITRAKTIPDSDWQAFLTCILLVQLGFTLLFTILLMPTRQALQDWARYRHVNAAEFATSQTDLTVRSRPLLQDLIWGEKSPPTLALGIHLVVSFLAWLGLVLWAAPIPHGEYSDPVSTRQLVSVLLVSFCTIAVYSIVLQNIFTWKTKQRHAIALFTIFMMIIAPFLIFAVTGAKPETMSGLWSMLAIGGSIASFKYVGFLTLLGVAIEHLAITTLGTMYLSRHLHKMGRSTTQKLLHQKAE